MRASVTRPVTATSPFKDMANGSRYKLGQRIRHEKFGDGVVLQMEGEGAQERVQINFSEVGIKWLMLAYAKLEAI